MTMPTGVTFRIGNQEWPDVEGLVTTTETPGGYKECRFSLPSLGHQVNIDDKLVIYDATHNAYPFIGRISNVHKTGLCFDFTATRSTRLKPHESTTGPGNPSHPSGTYAGKIYRAGTPIVQALQDALTLCEDVFDGGITDPGLQFVRDSNNLAGFVPEQIWNYISGLIGFSGTPLLWHIRGEANQQVVVIDYQDVAARYRVTLDEDKIDETWDAEQIITRAAVEYGNDQVYAAQLLAVSQAGRQLTHTKYVNGSSELASTGQAQALVGFYLAQLGVFRAAHSVLTLECNQERITAVPPVGSSDDWPLWLVESGHGIALVDRPTTMTPYDEALKYIIGTEYDWSQGKLTLTCGLVGGTLAGTINETIDYNVNRLFHGPYNGPPGGNHPLADADLLPQVGPELGVPITTSYGVPAFKDAQTAGDPNVPHGKQVDPDLIADEGLEANFNLPVSSLGYQGGIRVIPGTFNEYEIILGNASTIKVADTVTIELYKETVSGGTAFLGTISSAGLGKRVAVLSPLIILARGDFVLFKVTVAASAATPATWAAISLHAKKLFPALKS